MFTKTRLQLTGWYLGIILLISMVFSFAIYKALTFEIDRALKIQRYSIEHPDEDILPPIPSENHIFGQFTPGPGSRGLVRFQFRADPEVLEETKSRIRFNLILINAGILVFAGGAGFFLAGKTLRPIKDMIDEQNRFVADSSHELRTPLTALKTSIEVGLRDKKLTLSEAKTLLSSSLEEINRLGILSDSLLELAHFQKGHNQMQLERVQLDEIILQAIHKVTPLADTKHIGIETSLEPIELSADRKNMLDLMVIFIDNAIKYSPEHTTISISTKTTEAFAKITIKDHGEGISPEDIPHIFDRFYRADKSRTTSSTSGFGLGLSIAKKIIENHKGMVTVKSNLHKGTVFTIQLPLKK